MCHSSQNREFTENRTCYADIVARTNLKCQKGVQLTGRSIKTPIGTTEAMSVKVLISVFFSFSVNSSPIRALLSKLMAAATSIARSWVPCQTSCLSSSRLQISDVSDKKPHGLNFKIPTICPFFLDRGHSQYYQRWYTNSYCARQLRF